MQVKLVFKIYVIIMRDVLVWLFSQSRMVLSFGRQATGHDFQFRVCLGRQCPKTHFGFRLAIRHFFFLFLNWGHDLDLHSYYQLISSDMELSQRCQHVSTFATPFGKKIGVPIDFMATAASFLQINFYGYSFLPSQIALMLQDNNQRNIRVWI